MAVKSSPPLRLLALGDSYTVGESVDPSQTWPAQLAAQLRAEGCKMVDPAIIAQTGWTTSDLLGAIQSANLQRSFDLVTLLIGVNNQYQGKELGSYQEDFSLLLAKAIGFAGEDATRVIVISIPDWGVTPFAKERDRHQIRSEIDQFNDINRLASLKAGANYIDVTPISRKAWSDPTLLAPDQLHPSGKMYAAWVVLMMQLLQGIFRWQV